MIKLKNGWLDVQRGQRLRWILDVEVLRATIVEKAGSSLCIQVDGQKRTRNVPDAQHYFARAEAGFKTERMDIVEDYGIRTGPGKLRDSASFADEFLPLAEVAASYGVPAKQVRVWLRRGHVAGAQDGSGLWKVSPLSLERHLADRR